MPVWMLAGMCALGMLQGQTATPPAPPAPPAPPSGPPAVPAPPRRYVLPRIPNPPPQSAGITSPVAPAQPLSNRSGVVVRPVPHRPAGAGALIQPIPLVFEADVLEATVQAGQTNLVFVFRFTNTAPDRVTIERVHASCGCTTPKLPAMPWVVEPGTNGVLEVAFDARGKRGQISKMLYLYTSAGFKALTVRATLPETSLAMSAQRNRNLQLAAADRQAVFKGDCARCHATPGEGRAGRELFQAVCGICHEAEHRAEMVPDLRALRGSPGAEHWRQWITHGKVGTLMPAFSRDEGGPLSQEQIDSLVEYLTSRFPPAPPQYLVRPQPTVQ